MLSFIPWLRHLHVHTPVYQLDSLLKDTETSSCFQLYAVRQGICTFLLVKFLKPNSSVHSAPTRTLRTRLPNCSPKLPDAAPHLCSLPSATELLPLQQQTTFSLHRPLLLGQDTGAPLPRKCPRKACVNCCHAVLLISFLTFSQRQTLSFSSATCEEALTLPQHAHHVTLEPRSTQAPFQQDPSEGARHTPK